MRTFIAIEMPEIVKKELMKIQKEIDLLGLVKGKFTEEENMHLTLKFLGEISRSETEAVKEKLSNLKFEPFEVELGDLGVFSQDFIRIIWIGLKSEKLSELQKIIDKNLEDIFPPEQRFMAHVTLVRPKYVEDNNVFLDELKKIKFENKKFIVNSVSLKKSELTSSGAKYTSILEAKAI